MTCKGVTARYSRITVVSGVDLSLHAGELLAVLGANGAGKSSMLGAIAGIVNGGGEIRVRGRSVGRLSTPARAATGIAFVPEQRGNIFATMSVRENIDVGLRLLPPGERELQREFILELFPILKQRDQAMAGVLSGGEQQMLAIGLALGRNPDVLILDEPSQGLAPAVFDILEHAFDILKRKGLALLLAEQNVPFAARVADRYIIMSYGSVVQTGGREDLENPEELADAFMGAGNG
ncbi:ATP-binding cassette domain-containing protein [Nitratireductor mangrovi]|uniref:ATP-binding cassette domain-containing protein n=1 Tax=Nitratireductor mangrovi TaxID=2599600 RepID=A0A5B8L7P8_9HYPH|nr:ATP-binding cassette domain-containing protein [Nitratireductor mangrovi]QDZ03418.1 ATP-binding cassette domain-containing protein [Nitratireductor mangrovi]